MNVATALGVLLIIAVIGGVAYFATRPQTTLPPLTSSGAALDTGGGGYDRTATDAALVMSGAGDLLGGIGTMVGGILGGLGTMGGNAAGGAAGGAANGARTL